MKSASSEWAARAFAALLGIALLGTETSAFAAEALCPQINKIVEAATDTPSFNSVAVFSIAKLGPSFTFDDVIAL